MSMTIEQAKSELMQIYGALSPDKQRAIDTLLKIEPCEDAISRKKLIKNLGFLYNERGIIKDARARKTMEVIMGQTPVNPQEPKYCDRNICIKNEYNGIGCDECEVTKSQEPKIGKWIEEDVFDGDVAYRCSECNELFWIESGTPKDNEYNFCPKCGARMESEVQNESID